MRFERVTTGILAATASVGSAQVAAASGDSSLPQLNPATFPSQIFWLVVSFAILYLLISRLALPRLNQILQTRSRSIDSDHAAARRFRREAETLVEEMAKARAEAMQESKAYLQKKHHSLQKTLDDQREEEQKKIAEQIGEQEQQIANKRADALASLNHMAGELIGECVVAVGGTKPEGKDVENALRGGHHG